MNPQTSKSDFFISTADWHFGKRKYGLKHLEQDRYDAAWQIVKYAAEKGAKFILNGGDLLDVTRPGSAAVVELGKIHAFLVEHSIPMYLVQGNHDKSDPPWFSLFDTSSAGGIKLLNGNIVEEKVMCGETTRTLTITGYDETPREKLKEKLNKAPSTDILLLHAATKEFFSFPTERTFCVKDDVPKDKYKLIVVGDIHVSEAKSIGKSICLSPGSIEVGERSEARQKYFWTHTMQGGSWVDKKVSLVVRNTIDLMILTEDSVEEGLKKMEDADALGSTIHFYYNPEIPGIVERVLAKRKNPNTYVAPEAAHTTDNDDATAVEIANAESVEDLLPLTSFICDFTDDEIVEAAAKVLLDAYSKPNIDDVLNTLAEATFQELSDSQTEEKEAV